MLDPANPPERVLFDTGALLGAIDEANNADQACKDALDHLLRLGRTVGIASATIAEVLRHDGAFDRRLPKMGSFETLAFDKRAAEIVGAKLPMAVLRDAPTRPMTCMKLDAVIVGTAVRWNYGLIIYRDTDIPGLAARAGIQACTPEQIIPVDLFAGKRSRP